METGYVRVADTKDFEVGKMKKITLEDRAILIVNFEGGYFAVDTICTHYGGDLSEGTLEGKIITCPVHKARFDVTTGKVISPPIEALDRPDIENLPTFSLKILNQEILIKI